MVGVQRIGDYRYMANCAKELSRTQKRAWGMNGTPSVPLPSEQHLLWLSKQAEKSIERNGDGTLYIEFEGCCFYVEKEDIWEPAY